MTARAPGFALPPAPETAGPDELRALFVRAARDYLARAHREAERVLESSGGFACAGYLAEAQDHVIRALFDLARTRLYRADNPTAGERIAILAVGGYGRGTLAPGSDTDILFLLPVSTPWGESVAEAMLYALWDLGLKIGHATRTVDECIRAGREDLTVRTALLEARLLAGDAALFAEFQARFDRQVVAGRAAEFVQAKLAERDERILRAGQSRYLVEPNVKEGKGGQRDLQTLYWIVKYAFRTQDPRELIKTGFFTAREVGLFRRCEEFLWRVRCHLHFAAGRAEERLSFDMQRLVAQRMGYADRGALSAVERFMKHYFLVAKQVGDLSAIVSAALEAREDKPRAMLDRFVRRLRRRSRPLQGTRAFILDKGRISIANADVFRDDPVNLIRLFWYADRDQLAIHPHATRLVTLSLRHIDDALRGNAEANALFLDILTSKRSPEVVLRLMHESGVLGRFIPDFARISAMMQFSMYHHYTVDEHTLRCIGILARLDRGELGDDHPLSHNMMPTLQNRRALYVALFLHDIGKGRNEAHEHVGARIARALCPRLGLTPQETDTVSWLVENHLVMSQTAQGRDIGDPRTIATFAGIVQTLERLKLLLVLTVCDIRGVGPGVWNGWKGQLLRALYRETEVMLSGESGGIERSARIAEAQRALAAALPDWPAERLRLYAQRHAPAYWMKVDLPHQVKHARLMEKAERSGERFQVETATDAFRGVTELTVMAIDHPRLLSIIFGACAAAGANIVEAQIFTTNDGFALDTIAISRAFDQDNDEMRRAERVARHIVATLKGEVRLPEIVASRQAQSVVPAAFSVPPEVVIDNELSAKATVVEVTGLDRPGLLYELTTEFGKQNLNVNSARIVTYGEKAVDVFYVTDLTGGKITQAPRQQRLRKALIAVLSGSDGIDASGAPPSAA
ncbi:MAG: [protein-PII] uridylyltransferase [Hyphomicrobiales bacterium]|uniref:[protein-PII] uridylyltransferase n=1 Tax=Rhabdaerophilum calidifontis TaxID=2604328 RepID=UPI0012389631|nr:[protein-PII] uridylyltransferase [Rhabdaerophilum calidifontis]MCA1999206.1 [protein-PII] uridylyltransferase [Hyphomicrobiales bacterium]